MNTGQKIKQIREMLVAEKEMSFQRAIELRARLEVYAEGYKSKNSPAKILSFISRYGNGLQLKRVHPQDSRVPFIWQMFTPKSQWVCGDSPTECFDRAILTKGDWTSLSTTDVNALIMAHQAIKDAKEEKPIQIAEID